MHPIYPRTNKVKRVYTSFKSPSTNSFPDSSTLQHPTNNSGDPNQLVSPSFYPIPKRSRSSIPGKHPFKRRLFNQRPKFHPTKSRYFTKFYQQYKGKSLNTNSRKKKRRTVPYFAKISSKKTLSAKGSGNAKVVLSNRCTGNIDKVPKNRSNQTYKRESLIKTRSGQFAESPACTGNQTLYDSSRIEFLNPQDAKPSTKITSSYINSLVKCQVCSQNRVYQKYARHLRMHVRNKEVTEIEMRLIIFQTKFSRRDTEKKVHNNQIGNICSLCNSHVLNLKTHLLHVHSIHAVDGRYSEIFNASQECFRKIHFKSDKTINTNPSYGFRNHKVLFPSRIETNDIPKAVSVNNSVYDFHADDCSQSSEEEFILPSSQLREQVVQSIYKFQKFLSTNWGGSKSQPLVKMDVANVRSIFNDLGVQKIWQAEDMNAYFTALSNKNLSPITVHAKLRSFRRYIDYLSTSNRKLLPSSKNLEILNSMLKGVEKSLLRERRKCMKKLMSKNRINYDHTINVLKRWRQLRITNNPLELVDLICDSHSNIIRQDYDAIRNYFITELVIPNGQRAGIIPGINIQEVKKAENEISKEGYHKIMIAEHKTGHLNPATIFVYPEVFSRLFKFVTNILPRIPAFSQNQSPVDESNKVFICFNGSPITSSDVTPLLRGYLKTIGLVFRGTITDFRRASATLTGQFIPHLSENMAQFLGHSRRVHDGHYRMTLGHFGLSEIFKQLEIIQSTPNSSVNLSAEFNDTSLTISSPIERNQSYLSLNSLNTFTSVTNDPDVSNSYTLDFELSNTIPFKDSADFGEVRSIDDTIEKSISLVLDDVDTGNSCYSHLDQLGTEISSTIPLDHLDSEISTNSQNIIEQMILNRNLSPISKRTRSKHSVISNKTNELRTKECRLIITPNLSHDTSSPPLILEESLFSKLYQNSHHKSIFRFRDEEYLFVSNFTDLIDNISRRVCVTRKTILDRAFSTSILQPLISRLREVFSNKEVEKKIVNKVRTLGYKTRNSHFSKPNC